MSFAFVVPRYGPQMVGGAEALARHFAEQLVQAGERVSVFTTCVTNFVTWKNALPAGETQMNGVSVRRFAVYQPWPRQRHSQLHGKILSNENLTVDEQFEWVDTGPHSPALYQALANEALHFEFVFVIPYPFALSHYAAAIARERAILWPCLHDETYAYLAPTQLMLREARGMIFNVEAERRLALEKLKIDHPAAYVVGMGLTLVPQNPPALAQRFRQECGIQGPFILYAGRNSPAKNVPLLLDYFSRYKATHARPLKLVLMGSSPDPEQVHPDVIALGALSERQKYAAYAAALVLCQPSLNESFSIVLMEAWQMGTPALVHRDCAVTREHVSASNGGLYFGYYEEFEAAIDLLLAQPSLRNQLGENGQRYVHTEYAWPVVMQRFRAGLDMWRMAVQHSAL